MKTLQTQWLMVMNEFNQLDASDKYKLHIGLLGNVGEGQFKNDWIPKYLHKDAYVFKDFGLMYLINTIKLTSLFSITKQLNLLISRILRGRCILITKRFSSIIMKYLKIPYLKHRNMSAL